MKFSQVDITKEELNALPAEELPFPAHLVDDRTPLKEVKRLCKELDRSDVLGFDTETKPNFKKGVPANKVALLQLASPSLVVLFRLNLLGGTPAMEELGRLLKKKKVLKVGVGIRDDVKDLLSHTGLVTLNVLDLRRLSEAAGLEVLSLSKMYALLFGKRLSKGQRVSNWENRELSEAQIEYAALDAVAGLRIYGELKEFETAEMRVPDFRKAERKAQKKRRVMLGQRKRKADDGAVS